MVSLSIMTEMIFLFEALRGNPTMKSMEIESHFQVAISSGLSSPTGH